MSPYCDFRKKIKIYFFFGNLNSYIQFGKVSNSLRILNQPALIFKLYGVDMCLNLDSPDREILQMKI